MAALARSSWDLRISSWNLPSRPTGRLSTQKKPRSSSARRKVPFPEPLRPVMMMKEDGCMGAQNLKLPVPPFSSFGFNPPDITVLPLVDDVHALRVRVSAH